MFRTCKKEREKTFSHQNFTVLDKVKFQEVDKKYADFSPVYSTFFFF